MWTNILPVEDYCRLGNWFRRKVLPPIYQILRRLWSSGIASHLYSKGTLFESRHGHPLSWLRCSTVFLSLATVSQMRPRALSSISFLLYYSPVIGCYQSQWLRGLRVRIPLKAWMSVLCVFILCIGRGLATGWTTAQGVLPTAYRIKKPKKAARAQQRAVEP
jgi:hypothetical protein